MTTPRFSATTTPARWCSAGALALLAFPLCAQSELDRLARAYHDKPTPAGRAALQRLASSPGRGQESALADLALGVTSLDSGDEAEALRRLTAAQRALPSLADYIAYWIGTAHAAAKNPEAVPPALEAVWRSQPPSPLQGRAAVLGAQAWLDSGRPKAALDLLNRFADRLPQPEGRFLVGQAQEALADWTGAAASYQAVYYGYPQTPQALEARAGIARAQQALGDQYPGPSARLRLDRATKLMENRGAAQANAEFEQMIPLLTGADRDTARVRAGAADYFARKTDAALAYLRSLQVETPEADAERLYYVLSCHRRLDHDEEMLAPLNELTRRYPQSPWRLKGLVSAANRFLVENAAAQFVPLYEACDAGFPDSEDAPMCHWKVVWRAYLERKSAADPLLREHLRKYPGYEKAGASLYYLGRLAEQRGDQSGARRFYQELQQRFPNYYYALLARQQLARPEIAQAPASPETESFLKTIRYPERPTAAVFQAAPGFDQRVARARLLARAALDTWSDGELRYAARNEGQAYPAALELAELAQKRGQPQLGMRYIKSHAQNYLFLPFDAAPERFWRLAFPYPYRSQIHMYAQERGLDEFVLAGLIRQESEFDAKIVSYAGAIGLTQVMPGTGRELSRRIGLRGYRTSSLTNAEINLRLGTYYLKDLLNSLDGSLEQALASYNGGRTRVLKWREWGPFNEPAEMVETIPLNQTRDYVQIILRNADLYRRLYGAEPPPPPPAQAAAAPAPAKSTKPNAAKKPRKR